MFKKRFKVSSSHSLSKKDEKKLKEALTKYLYVPELLDNIFNSELFPEDDALTI